jgi:hypothetical protein
MKIKTTRSSPTASDVTVFSSRVETSEWLLAVLGSDVAV